MGSESEALAQALLRLPEVMAATGLPRSSIDAKERAGDFPARVKLGLRAIAWRKADVDRWIAQRVVGGPTAIRTGVSASRDCR